MPVTKNLNDGSITLKDGTGTPISVTATFDAGTFTVSGLKRILQETVAYETRGVLNSLRYTSRVYPTGSFTLHLTDFTGAGSGDVVDAIMKAGDFASAVSTRSGEVYTLDITFTVEGTDHSDGADHDFTLEDCECSIDVAEGDPSTITVNFTCYGAVTGDIVAALAA